MDNLKFHDFNRGHNCVHVDHFKEIILAREGKRKIMTTIALFIAAVMLTVLVIGIWQQKNHRR